ncbi:MT-A70-like protein, partial [Trichophaea hybrida]
VLLDPPWPNASAKRKRGGYKTESRFSIMPLLLGLPMCDVLNTGGVVGVWITNKPSIRRQLGSLLSAWCVDEVAEWVWVKTTSFGKPVFALDSKSGRRPYEVLVLARRSGGPEIPDKVIVGVPDLHSRKPGVKDLIEPFLPERYEAAEIFGRNLTEGWFTWGDEAIKWN